MLTLNLYGQLGSRVGKSHWELEARSVFEALGAVEIQTKKLLPTLRSLEKEFNVAYEMFIDGKLYYHDIDLSRLLPPGQDHTVDFVPMIRAGKSDWLQTVIGAIIVVGVSYFTGGLFSGQSASLVGQTGWAGTTTGQIVYTGVAMVGMSMVLGGISQMLVRSPDSSTAEGNSQESYLFSGSFNRMSQGGPIPVLLGGPLRIGSQTINGFAEISETTGTSSGLVTMYYTDPEEVTSYYDDTPFSEYEEINWVYEGDGAAPDISDRIP